MFDYKKESVHIVTATKEIIDWLLSLNTHNRSIKRSHVDSLKKQISENNWFFTNQGIGVSRSGFLTDGQHRLLALKECGYPPLKILIVLGLDEKAQAVVDTHAKRSQADVIRLLMNRTTSNQAVALINVKLMTRTDGVKFTQISGKSDTFEVADMLNNYSDVLTPLLSACGNSMRASVGAALFEYAIRYSVDHACRLGEQIKDGVNLDKNHPAYRLRTWLESNKASSGPVRIQAYSNTVSACIAHAKGESLQLLRPASSWARLPKPPQMY